MQSQFLGPWHIPEKAHAHDSFRRALSAHRALTPNPLEVFTPRALRGRFVKTRGNPLLRLPRAIFPRKLLQIPTPFNNLASRVINSDEAKRTDPLERQGG